MSCKAIPDSVRETIVCALSNDIPHYSYEAILLPCGATACKYCVELALEDKRALEPTRFYHNSFDCKCKESHSFYSRDVKPIPHVRIIIESHLNDLKNDLFEEIKEFSEAFKDENINEKLDIRLECIEFELDLRVESIINSLHEYRERLKKEMDDLRVRYKQKFKLDTFQKMRIQLDELLKKHVEVEIDYEEFIKSHKIINESKHTLVKYLNELKEIQITSQQKTIFYEDLVGELEMPLWKRAKASHVIPINYSKKLAHFVCSKKRNILFDADGSVFTMQENVIERYQKELGKLPVASCIGKSDQLFVVDAFRMNRVVIFDKNLSYIRQFKIDKDAVDRMQFDLCNTERSSLYITHLKTNKITIWETESGRLLDTIKIDSPQAIKLTKEFAYVVSFSLYEADSKTGQLVSITSGSNCIFVLKKSTHEIVNKIIFDNWLQPYGLALDEHENILTLAFELGIDNAINNNTYLHVINKESKELVRKIKLDDDRGEHCDMTFYENKLMILYEKSIKMIGFEPYL